MYKPNLVFKAENKTIQNLYFSDTAAEFVYYTKIEAFKNTVTGLLVIKPIANNQHRVLLSTEFGNTLLDLTITENSYIKNYAIPDLDRKIILNMLSRDFKIMLTQNWQVCKVSSENTNLVYASFQNRNNYYLTYSNDQLQSIQFAKSKPKLLINYSDIVAQKANTINIEHLDYNIKIQMIKIDF